jgi:hypothetical protein
MIVSKVYFFQWIGQIVEPCRLNLTHHRLVHDVFQEDETVFDDDPLGAVVIVKVAA